ncbi:hypothetical protein GRJ2_001632500 [Grus japonensis]|uniref:Uncharacterized protein n=1 Tax=Grus japonensis TaxID=30415 RepID=A0ABC9X2N3_GRUJA
MGSPACKYSNGSRLIAPSRGTAQPWASLRPCKDQTDAKVAFSNMKDSDIGLLSTLASTGEAMAMRDWPALCPERLTACELSFPSAADK